MPSLEFEDRIRARAASSELDISGPLLGSLRSYFELLAKWNRTINLTGFSLESPSDEAIDRLLIEPLIAAKHVDQRSKCLVDVGSGGGSPAIPMKLALPGVALLLVESHARKAAFLREVGRHLALPDVQVANERVEVLAGISRYQGISDVVTVRAVAIDAGLLASIQRLLAPKGQVFLFGSRQAEVLELLPSGWTSMEKPLLTAGKPLLIVGRAESVGR